MLNNNRKLPTVYSAVIGSLLNPNPNSNPNPNLNLDPYNPISIV